MSTIKLEIEVGKLETQEDLRAFLLRLAAWEAKRPEQTYAIGRRRTDVRRVEEKQQQRNGRDGLL